MIIFLLVILSPSYLSAEIDQDVKSTAGRINISFADQSYDTLLLRTAYLNRIDSIFLDSSGFASFDLPVEQPTFTFLIESNPSNPIKLIIDDSFVLNIVRSKEDKSINFTGKGANLNAFLNELTNYESELTDFFENQSSKGWENKEDIINSYFLLENMVNDFSENYTSNLNDENLHTLILNECLIHCKYLAFKNLVHFTLGKDTLLNDSDLKSIGVMNILKSDRYLTSSSHNIYNLLMIYNNYLIRKTHLENTHEVNELEILNAKRIAKDFKLAKTVREYLVYYNIYSSITHNGLNEKTFDAIEFFENKFKGSRLIEELHEQINEFNTLSEGKKAFPISFQNTLGENMSLENFTGKFIFIDVWATWCGPCLNKMPEIESLVDLFPEIQFIFLNIESEKPWRKHIENLDTNKLKNHFNLTSSDFRLKYKMTRIPRYILIDRSGNIVDAFYHHKDTESFMQVLSKNLE